MFIWSQLCVAGTFQGSVGRDVCDACPQGSANAAEGSGTCAPCAVGTFASDAGLTRCEACEPGTYQDKTGKASCVDCPAGTQNPLAASDDASACVACPAGTHSGVKSTECVTCPAETFAASEKATVCEECPMHSSPADGKTRCACDPGHVETASSSFTCEPCAPGGFAEAPDSKFCDLCGGDGYAAKNGTDAVSFFLFTYLRITTMGNWFDVVFSVYSVPRLRPGTWATTSRTISACSAPKLRFRAPPGRARVTCSSRSPSCARASGVPTEPSARQRRMTAFPATWAVGALSITLDASRW